jgi:hypothetical protein
VRCERDPWRLTWRNQDGTAPVVFEKWGERSAKNKAYYHEPSDCFSLLT